MPTTHLYDEGTSALANKMFLEALQHYAKLYEQKLDLTQTWELEGSIAKIQVEDIDFNLMRDIGVASCIGRFTTHFLSPQSNGPFLDRIDCHDFCFFRHGADHAVLLGGAGSLSAYRFKKVGERLGLEKIGDLPLRGEEVSAVTHWQNGLYVSTRQMNIHRFDAFTLSEMRTCGVSAVVKQLISGGRNNAGSITGDRLLGVRQEGGLVLIDFRGGILAPSRPFGQEIQYTDAFVADPNNAGGLSIIACTFGGRLDIYSPTSLQITDHFDYPDEFSTIYCNDIDEDGQQEVLVGGKNSIYAFVIDRQEQEVRVKWRYETEASVTDMWVGDVAKNDKRLVAGLANGKLQVFTLHRDAEIYRGMAEAFDGLIENSPSPADAYMRMVTPVQPEALRFGLEHIPRASMQVAEWVGFLNQVEKDADAETWQLILSKIKGYLKRFDNDPALVDYVIGFSNRLFARYPTVQTCERIYSTLRELANSGLRDNEQVSALVVDFRNRQLLLSNPSPQREAEHLADWSREDLLGKIVLIALSSSDAVPLNLSGIHRGLKRPVVWLVSENDLLFTVTSLLSAGRIDQHDTGGTPYYSFRDADYSAWVRYHSELLMDTIQQHRDELLQLLRVIDVGRIDSDVERSEGGDEFFACLGIDSKKWQCLILLSRLVGPPAGRSSLIGPSLTSALDLLFCKCLGAVFCKEVTVPVADALCCSLAFEMKLPEIKFVGFDKILVVILSAEQNIDLDVCLKWAGTRLDWSIVIVLAGQNADSLRSTLPQDAGQVAIFGNRELIALLLSQSPREVFLDILASQIALAALTPFQYAGAVTDKMFYGRALECQQIINSMRRDSKTMYAVSCGRRIGKTSLLQRVKTTLDRMDEEREREGKGAHFKTVFLDVDGVNRENLNKLYSDLLRELDIYTTGASRSDFMDEVRKYSQRSHLLPVFFLDEVDDLLRADQPGGYEFLKALRALVNEERVKLVITGYRILYFEMQNAHSPLYNFFQLIELSALEKDAAYALVMEPLKPVFHIEAFDVSYILEKTACYPNFIQFCCSHLVTEVASRANCGREITRADIDRVVSCGNFYDYMIGVYNQNLDDQSRLLLYLMALSYEPALGKILIDPPAHEAASKSGYAEAFRKFELATEFSADDLCRLVQSYRRSLSRDDAEFVIKKLVLASIFKRGHNSRVYSFRLPDLPVILRERVDILDQAVELLDHFTDIFKSA